MSNAARLFHPALRRLDLWIGALVLVALLQFPHFGAQSDLTRLLTAPLAQGMTAQGMIGPGLPVRSKIETPKLALIKSALPETRVRLVPVLHLTSAVVTAPRTGFSLLVASPPRDLAAAQPAQGWQARAPPFVASPLI